MSHPTLRQRVTARIASVFLFAAFLTLKYGAGNVAAERLMTALRTLR